MQQGVQNGYIIKLIMLNKLNTKNPLRILFIFVYKSYESSKSDKGIEYFSSVCFYLVILFLYVLAFTEFLGLREKIFDKFFDQHKVIIFLTISLITILLYSVLKRLFPEEAIKAIKLTNKEIRIGSTAMYFTLFLAIFIGIIAHNYNRCNVLSIKPGFGFEKENPKCCNKCE